jgi:acetyl esterase/lipase
MARRRLGPPRRRPAAGDARRRHGRARHRACALIVLALAGCGDGLRRERIGSGALEVTVVRARATRAPLPAVLFLHGWNERSPDRYRGWIDHLAREGNVVLYPRYQRDGAEPPAQVLDDLLRAMRAAAARVPLRPGSLVIVGHSAGGALGAEYAAAAARLGLPVPRALFAAFPGVGARGRPPRVPAPGPLPAGLRVVALAGAADRVVGDALARRLGGAFEVVRAAGADDHMAPARDSALTRRVFWRAADALIRSTRGGQASGSRPSQVPSEPSGTKRANSSSPYQRSWRVRRIACTCAGPR